MNCQHVQQRLLATLLQRLYGLPGKPLSFDGATFGEQSAGASIIYLSKMNVIATLKKRASGA